MLKQPTRQVRQMDWTDRRWRLLVMLSCLVTSVQMEGKYIIILKYNRCCDSQSQAMIPLQCIMDVTKGPHHLLNVSCVTFSVQSIEGSIFSSCEIKAILSGFRDNVTVQWFLATRQQWLEPRSVYSVEYLIPSINTPESLVSLLGAAEMYIQRPHHCNASSSQAEPHEAQACCSAT